MVCGIYKIKNKINDKVYIGKSINIKKRFSQHNRKLNNGNHENDHLQNSFNKYGEENFSFEIIEESGPEYLDELEKFYIAFYDAMNPEFGYNQTEGGDGCLGYNHTDEFKKKKSEAMSGENNPRYWLGKTLPEETKKKMSEAKIGDKNPMYGKQHSEESRAKMSEAHSKYTLWNPAKCHYVKTKMYRGKRDGSAPVLCFTTKYHGKDLPIGLNMDFTTAEIIHDLIDDACKK